MHNWLLKSVFVSFLFAWYAYSYDPKTHNPDGVVVVKPNHLKQLTPDFRIFTSVIPNIVSESNVKIAFHLAYPCPPANIYYGLVSEGTPDVPFYFQRTQAKVSQGDANGYGTEQETKGNLEKLFFDRTLSNDTVCFRIEVYVPARKKTVIYDGRFTCHHIDGHIEILSISTGPIVDCITPDSAIISWETDKPTHGKVYLGSSAESMREAATSSESSRHEVLLTGLSPANSHYYQIVATREKVQVKSRIFQFNTAPDRCSTFKFAVMIDSRSAPGGPEFDYAGVNLKILRDLTTDAQRLGISAIFFVGDLITGYSASTEDVLQQFGAWNQAVESTAHSIPIYEGIGNHEMCVDVYDDGSTHGLAFDKEGAESTEALFAEVFVNPQNGPESEHDGLPTYKENVYYVDYGQIRFIMLNSSYWVCSFPEEFGGNLDGYIMPKQMEWLKRVLEDAQSSSLIQHVFVGIHAPFFPTNRHIKDSMWYEGGKSFHNYGRKYILQRRDELWQMLLQCPKVVTVIAGHEHNYARLYITKDTPVYPNGEFNPKFHRPMWLFITGGAGAPLYPVGEIRIPWKDAIVKMAVVYHYLLFTVSPEKVSMECIAHNGTVVDTCTIWQK